MMCMRAESYLAEPLRGPRAGGGILLATVRQEPTPIARSHRAQPSVASASTRSDVLAVLTCPGRRARPASSDARRASSGTPTSTRIGIPGSVTYSRKVFIPLTYMCRYRCSYCTFVKTREDAGAEFRSMDEVLAIANEGREWGCTEALFTLGEAPEERHDEAQAWLEGHGYDSTVEYVHRGGASASCSRRDCSRTPTRVRSPARR